MNSFFQSNYGKVRIEKSLFWTPEVAGVSVEFGSVYPLVRPSVGLPRKTSELALQFLPIFFMKLDSYKVRKMTKPDFEKRVPSG